MRSAIPWLDPKQVGPRRKAGWLLRPSSGRKDSAFGSGSGWRIFSHFRKIQFSWSLYLFKIWSSGGATCIGSNVVHQHQVGSHALPHCLELPYWHYQLVTSGPIDRTPGLPNITFEGPESGLQIHLLSVLHLKVFSNNVLKSWHLDSLVMFCCLILAANTKYLKWANYFDFNVDGLKLHFTPMHFWGENFVRQIIYPCISIMNFASSKQLHFTIPVDNLYWLE